MDKGLISGAIPYAWRNSRAVLGVLLLAHGERNVAIFDHMLNLLAHYQDVSEVSAR